MRVISQDDSIDIPYENSVLMVDRYGDGWGIFALCPGVVGHDGGSRSICLGTFGSRIDAINEMNVIQDNYYKKERLYQVWVSREMS